MSENSSDEILTFLFTDLENSTPLWEQFPGVMRLALEKHDVLLKSAVEAYHGRVVKTTGDGLHAVFSRPADGIAAALSGQKAMVAETWPEAIGPLKVRMGLHTGESQSRDGDYYGSEVNLTARVMGLAYGGQILLSNAAAVLARKGLPPDCSLADLGEHRLKGIVFPERVFQLCHPDLAPDFPPLKSQETIKHNLHRQLSSFIGREKELAQIKKSLRETQLLTLLGPGGTGKTRLMLQAAEDILEDYPQGVWLVELASLANPAQIPERVAAVLNVQEIPGRPLIDTLTEYLRRKELLLLLDNVEHIVRESAEFSEHILVHCPKLRILVTGREGLFIRGEGTIQIPPLTFPEEKQTLEQISRSDGVKLFLERARAVRPDFGLSEQNANSVAEVVRRLDGIPLALELAAARLRMLTIEQINERLNDRFRLLTGGSRTALPRQQTLQALIDWSWKLLNEKEHILLRRLSVFAGGWNLESAQAVTAFEPLDDLDVFDHLEQLINKSLVTVKYPPGGEARYGMLESIRQYAQEKLLDAGEGEILRDRQVDYFVSFALKAEKHLSLPSMVVWVNRITQELDNLRSALTWARKDHPELALRISAALLHNWAQWIHPSEALAWLNAPIQATRGLLKQKNSPVRIEDFIKALYGLGFTQALLGEVRQSLETAQEGIQVSQENRLLRLYVKGVAQKFSGMIQHWIEIPAGWLQVVEEALVIAQKEQFDLELESLHSLLGGFYLARGEIEQAESHFQLMKGVTRNNPNPRSMGMLLVIEGQLALARGDLDLSRRRYEQAVEVFTSINDQRIALICKSTVSHLLRRAGRIAEAVPHYRDTILKWQEQGNPIAVAHQLECFAYIGLTRRKFELAVCLLGAAKSARVRLDAVSANPQEVAELEGAMVHLAKELGESKCAWLLAQGTEIDLDQAVQLALQEIS